MDHRSKNPVYSASMEELEEMLLEDILNHIDCQPWSRNEMTGAELEDWYIDFGYADGP